MGFVIPSGLISIYNEHIDSVIDFNGVDVVLQFPPLKTECPNCYPSTVTGRSSGTYRPGGPYPFTQGDMCPYCHDVGYKWDEQTQTIKMTVYWEPKNFVSTDSKLVLPDGAIQTKCHIQHLPKIEQCVEIRVHSAVTAYKTWVYERFRESIPHGFKSNNYILTYWKRK